MIDNIIKGPWKRVVTVSPEENSRVREDIEFVEELAERLIALEKQVIPVDPNDPLKDYPEVKK